jgi:hypothetical protein
MKGSFLPAVGPRERLPTARRGFMATARNSDGHEVPRRPPTTPSASWPDADPRRAITEPRTAQQVDDRGDPVSISLLTTFRWLLELADDKVVEVPGFIPAQKEGGSAPHARSRRPSQQLPRSSEGLLSFSSVFGSQPNQLRGDVTPDDEGPPRCASGTRGRRLARSVEEARLMGSPRGDHAMVHGARKSWAPSGLLRKGMSLTGGSRCVVNQRERAPEGPHPTGGPRVTEGAGGAGPSRKKCHGGPNEV